MKDQFTAIFIAVLAITFASGLVAFVISITAGAEPSAAQILVARGMLTICGSGAAAIFWLLRKGHS
ncbi:hypothetical protein ABMY26_07190 (plasmid) [Azospirillum sp. HJ39]|uniref:hypothetical protein n=1 Tax=Azospirillum sp. HJ39 TaxID=3159496 RepID=UPI00355810AB